MGVVITTLAEDVAHFYCFWYEEKSIVCYLMGSRKDLCS